MFYFRAGFHIIFHYSTKKKKKKKYNHFIKKKKSTWILRKYKNTAINYKNVTIKVIYHHFVYITVMWIHTS